MSNVSTGIALSFTTTDGTVFTARAAALKHQRKLDAIAKLAASLHEKFELDVVVGSNIAAHLAQQPDELVQLLGIVRRKKATDDAAGGEADSEGTDDPAADDTPL